MRNRHGENLNYLYDFILFKESYIDNERFGFLSFDDEGLVEIQTKRDSLGILVRTDAKLPAAKYRNIFIREIKKKNHRYIFVEVKKHQFYMYFYMIISHFIEASLHSSKLELDALLDQLNYLNLMVKKKNFMTERIARGLFGELYILRLILENKKGTIENWHGYKKNRTDFIFKNLSLEIKTTSSLRKHIITSSNQLSPRKNQVLYLCSIALDKGHGQTLLDIYHSINELLTETEKIKFSGYCILAGFNPTSLQTELSYYSLREPNRYYEITDDFPSLTPKRLEQIMAESTQNIQISDVKYILDFTIAKSYKSESQILRKIQ